MKNISQITKKTNVNIFFTLVLLVVSSSFAEAKDDDKDNGYSPAEVCRDIRNKYDTAARDINSLCRKAGIGGSCESKIESCNADAEDDGQINSMALLGTAMGTTNTLGQVLTAAGTQAKSSGCPQYTYSDYTSTKKDYQNDVKDAEEKLLDIQDQQTEAQEDFNKEIADLQEDLNKAQQDLEDKNNDLEEEARNTLQEFQKTQNEAKESLRQQATDLLKARGSLVTSQRDKALKLIAMTEASAKRACMKTVNEMKKNYEGSLSGLSSNTMIAKSKRMKADLIAAWTDCMSVYDQQRTALFESKKQEELEITKQITDIEESMTQTQDTLNLAQSQLTEIQNSNATKKSQAQQNLVKTMQSIQNKMTAAKQKLESTLKSLATKTETYNNRVQKTNAAITAMGAAPPSGATEVASQVSGEIYSLTKEMDLQVERASELEGYKCSLGGSSGSSRGSSSGAR